MTQIGRVGEPTPVMHDRIRITTERLLVFAGCMVGLACSDPAKEHSQTEQTGTLGGSGGSGAGSTSSSSAANASTAGNGITSSTGGPEDGSTAVATTAAGGATSTATTGMGESAVSHALRILRAHRIVKARRSGRMAYYSLRDGHVRMLLDVALEHARHSDD